MKRILCFSCLHAPITDKGYFNWLIGQIEEFKPHIVVNLGDWYEGKWAKRWAKTEDETWSVLAEHKAVAEQANAINAVSKATKVWLYGNHDDNSFNVHPDRTASDIVPAVHWQENKDVSKALEKWTVVRKYGHDVYKRFGPVTFQHGCETSKAGLTRQALYYGTPYGLYVCGHTHRPEERQIEVVDCPIPYWYANPGCGADWDRMHYITRQNKQRWGRGCLLIEAKGVDQSRSAFASKQWDCELKIHSLADERF